MTLLVFIGILSILILIHEFGHFSVARFFKIKVEEFGIGIPPKIKGKKIGETEYSINWLPFGGFVRLMGEDGSLESDPKSFTSKPRAVRAAVLIAGVTMNLLLAVALYYFMLWGSGFKAELVRLTDYQFPFGQSSGSIIISDVFKDSPADKSGIEPGDHVISINGQNIQSNEMLASAIQSHTEQDISIVLSTQSNATKTVDVFVRTKIPQGEGAIGIGYYELVNLSYQKPLQKLSAGVLHSINIAGYSVNIFKSLITSALQSHSIEPVSSTVTGPVGAYSIVGSILTLGSTQQIILELMNFTALFSLNLAMLNILPFPALDGGRLLFVGLETILRRRLPQKIEAWIHAVGMAVLLGLMALVTFKDIINLF